MQGDDSLGFLNMNRNKRSITLDLKSEAGRNVFFRLAETADVIVENYRPGAMKKLGVDYEAVSAVNPAIIYASISGFGQSGPWADRPTLTSRLVWRYRDRRSRPATPIDGYYSRKRAPLNLYMAS